MHLENGQEVTREIKPHTVAKMEYF